MRARSVLAVALVLASFPRAASAQDVAGAGAARCVAGDVAVLGASAARNLRVRVAYAAPDRGLVAWTEDVSHLRVRPLAARALPGDAIVVELGHANGLDVLAPAREGFVALTSGSMCDAGGYACSHSRALRVDGTPAGPPLDEMGHTQFPEVPHWASVPDGIAVAQVWRWGTRLARYTVAADGAVHVAVQPQSIGCPSGQPYDAMAVDGARVVVLTNTWCQNGPRYRIPLPGDAVEVHGVPTDEDVQVVRAALDGEDLLVITRGGGRPRLYRIGADGARATEPIAIDVGTPLPAPFAGRLYPRVTLARGRLVLAREDAAARVIGEPLEVARGVPSRTEHAVAWDGSGLVVVWATRDRSGWTVRARRATCA